jgi:molybdopterin/thiamine biosynthesis adenylyltransferase
MDHQVLTELDGSSQFLAPRDALGQNRAEASLPRAQQLNPMVEVTSESGKPDDKPDDFFTRFSVICATNCTKDQACRINRIARQHGIAFFASDVFGFESFIFSDLGEHHYKKELAPLAKDGKELGPPRVFDKVAHFIPYQDIFSIDWNLDDFASRVKKTQPALFAIYVLLEFCEKHKRKPLPPSREEDLKELMCIRDEYVERNGISKEKCPDELFANVFGELGPICAITGGQLAQEVVKAVSRKDDPLMNVYVFNPITGTAYVESFV